MSTNQQISKSATVSQGPRDLISRLYREIGISAVAAALEAASSKAAKPLPARKDIISRLRGDEAA